MNRYADFQKYKDDFLLFSEQFTINVEQLREDLQLELIDLQCISVLKSIETVGILEMFKYLGNSSPKLKKHFSNILNMFSNSYVYEKLFSLIKFLKLQSNLKCQIMLGTKEKMSSFKCSSKIKINK